MVGSGASRVRSSALYRSTPVDCAPDTPDFINAVISFCCVIPAISLLDLCQQIEVEFGRPRLHGYHQPRTLDLDIITAGDLRIAEKRLVVPHPEAHRRAFVLRPLSELDPDFVIPGHVVNITAMLAGLPGNGGDVTLLEAGW